MKYISGFIQGFIVATVLVAVAGQSENSVTGLADVGLRKTVIYLDGSTKPTGRITWETGLSAIDPQGYHLGRGFTFIPFTEATLDEVKAQLPNHTMAMWTPLAGGFSMIERRGDGTAIELAISDEATAYAKAKDQMLSIPDLFDIVINGGEHGFFFANSRNL